MYLAVLLDLHSRRVVGWAMGTKINQPLVSDALQMAIEHRQPRPDPVAQPESPDSVDWGRWGAVDEPVNKFV